MDPERTELTGARQFDVEVQQPPLKLPMSPAKFVEITGVPKSNLLRWDREGLFKDERGETFHLPMDISPTRYERAIGMRELHIIFAYMKTLRHAVNGSFRRNEGALKYPWLETFDPNGPCDVIITQPDGGYYQFTFKEKTQQ